VTDIELFASNTIVAVLANLRWFQKIDLNLKNCLCTVWHLLKRCWGRKQPLDMPRYNPSTESETPKSMRSNAQQASLERCRAARRARRTQPNGKENHPLAPSDHHHSTFNKSPPLQEHKATSTALAKERALRVRAETAAAAALEAAKESESKKKTLQKLFNNTKKKLARAVTSKIRLRAEVKSLKAISIKTNTQHVRETRILMQRIKNYKSELQHAKVILKETRLLLKAARWKIRHMRLSRLKLKREMERKIRAHLRKLSGRRLYVNGKFTKEARRLMRGLINLGCPMKNVGEIIRHCADATGVTLDAVPDRRTVWRAIIEGGLASQAQIIHELRNAKGDILSSGKLCSEVLTLYRFHCER